MIFAAAPHERRLMPKGRLIGPMPWIVAIMMFLTILATAAGLAFFEGGRSVGDQLASRLMVQVVDANPDRRRRQAQAASARLQQYPEVRSVRILSGEEVGELVEPWLGEGGLGDDIPLPALIDVTLDRRVDDILLTRLRQDVTAVAPAAQIDASASLVTPVTSLMLSLQWIAFALVALLAIATAALVIITARAALNAHRETVDIVHMLGGTDRQITRLIQRRIALDALTGGLIGLAAGVALIWLIGSQVAAFQSEMVASLTLSWWSWLIIALIPIIGMLLAMLTARWTVMASLKKIL